MNQQLHSVAETENPKLSPVDQSILKIWGPSRLEGNINISGAKNSALPAMAATLLSSGICRLRQVPCLADINTMGKVLSALGAKIKHNTNTLDIDASDLNNPEAPYELVRKLRASFFAIGPILARLGVARVPLPGGCAIGARPVDLHVRGLQTLGAEVHIEHGMVNAYITGSKKKLQGAKIYLDYPSVGATETLMMAATLAEGETIIENAAQEPEVEDLANLCIAMGAKIFGAGTKTIVISGVEKLHSVDYTIIPDRIEAGTFLIAGAITNSEITIAPVVPKHLSAVISKLQSVGVRIVQETPDSLRILPAEILKSTDIDTQPYPGFPTDMQAPFMALLSVCSGNSSVTETVFENRMRHVSELNRMGANIRVKGNHAVVQGVPNLSAAPVIGTDLRASAALIIAALAAEGETTFQGLQHLNRGYEQLDIKLEKLGAKLQRLDQVKENNK
ncbi:MAG: UDP-N-acetylglucosamine 1-carboxyvinyltransferase [Okeania sp. SIO3I5]|uniref:UDP-N-acetylglucosamine 1-carboxyvinyltransferase n=1 Tax=Okeania sp. SIO3I5 TaxID=2607805 RepID=UPI0013B80AD3|nr:UDP-N-acetylglucosamine 1-carboxyvinyltransferase [Okeania sp. SIO3I5]NEQ41629.1 UDP-N-acetylglucosamine 1-carboxyvinyltransferase [Okeania sp. SIO3I5]